MEKNRVYFGIMVFLLVTVIIWASYSMLNVGKDTERYEISIIVEDSSSGRWTALRQGLDAAANDYNINLNYVSVGNLTGNEEEFELIRREIENGADGIIVQMVSSAGAGSMEDISTKTAVILLETDVTPEEVYAFAGPDNTALGNAAADIVKEQFGSVLSGKKVGILSGNQEQLSMQQRMQGLMNGLADTGVEIAWSLAEEAVQTQEELYRMEKENPADIFIALSNKETERMVDYLMAKDGGADALLYGVGCSEKAVYYLDKGVIRTLVVPNEFNMGYQSMESMVKQLDYHQSRAQDSRVDYLVVDRANLYDADNQKILFPIVQ